MEYQLWSMHIYLWVLMGSVIADRTKLFFFSFCSVRYSSWFCALQKNDGFRSAGLLPAQHTVHQHVSQHQVWPSDQQRAVPSWRHWTHHTHVLSRWEHSKVLAPQRSVLKNLMSNSQVVFGFFFIKLGHNLSYESFFLNDGAFCDSSLYFCGHYDYK